jgi:hypothetical protein
MLKIFCKVILSSQETRGGFRLLPRGPGAENCCKDKLNINEIGGREIVNQPCI